MVQLDWKQLQKGIMKEIKELYSLALNQSELF